ncbi:MAG: VOC family protein [Proteobacteria bacterium]|nr:VOC family protein [Pseudomonadota bacterium]
MTHRSKLAGFIIDCNTDNLQEAAEFWGAALGMELQQLPAEEGERYVRLLDPAHGLHIEVQSVDHGSRVHLDIETDDMEAEIKRLQNLGASVADRVSSWCVMQAPTGQRFCVVKKCNEDFDQKASEW